MSLILTILDNLCGHGPNEGSIMLKVIKLCCQGRMIFSHSSSSYMDKIFLNARLASICTVTHFAPNGCEVRLD